MKKEYTSPEISIVEINTNEASTWEALKQAKADKRRLDAKFKAKNFKKAHRLATDPKTGKQDIDQMDKFYKNKQDKRHPGRNRHTSGYMPGLSECFENQAFLKNSWEQEVVDDYARREQEGEDHDRLFWSFEIKIKLMGYGIIV